VKLSDLVPEIEKESDPAAARRIARSRSKLLHEVAQSPRRRRVGGRLAVGIGGFGALVAGTAVIVAFVAGSVFAPVPATIPAASADEVFEQAAQSILDHVGAADTHLNASQYMRVEIIRDYLYTDGSQDLQPAKSGAFTHRDVDVLYVPANREDAWIFETKPTVVTGTYGPGGAKLLNSIKPGSDREAGVQAFPGGVRTYGNVTQPIDRFRDSYKDMPRDPQQLLDWFRVQEGEYAWMAILDALYMNLPPADLRAAMLGALAISGDFDLVSVDGNDATIQRTGNVDQVVQQFVIDRATGFIDSVTDLRSEQDDIVPPGIPNIQESWVVSVVDNAPTPTR